MSNLMNRFLHPSVEYIPTETPGFPEKIYGRYVFIGPNGGIHSVINLKPSNLWNLFKHNWNRFWTRRGL